MSEPSTFRMMKRREKLFHAGGNESRTERLCGRKRAASSDDEEMPDRTDRSPSPAATATSSTSYRPTAQAKRLCTNTSSTVQVPLSKLLEPLDKEQLIDLVTSIVQKHPELRAEVLAQLPRPTIQSATAVLSALERRLQAAFPYSRHGTGRDDYTFHRVRSVLDELRATLLQFSEHFVQPEEHSVTVFAYLALAAGVVERLPRWDNEEHERMYRGDLYRRLAELWQTAVDMAAKRASQGKIYGEQTVLEWYRTLERHSAQSDGALTKVLESFRTSLGWLIGLHTVAPLVNTVSSGHGLFSSTIY
jgi:hypothetical protein